MLLGDRQTDTDTYEAKPSLAELCSSDLMTLATAMKSALLVVVGGGHCVGKDSGLPGLTV